MINESEAWNDLGGNVPKEISDDSIVAIVKAGLGSEAMGKRYDGIVARRAAHEYYQQAFDLSGQEHAPGEPGSSQKRIAELTEAAAALMMSQLADEGYPRVEIVAIIKARQDRRRKPNS